MKMKTEPERSFELASAKTCIKSVERHSVNNVWNRFEETKFPRGLTPTI